MVIQPVKDCVALLEAFERVGKPCQIDGRRHWEGERVMKQTMTALLVAGGALASALGVGAATTPAQAQGKTITLCWSAWDPAIALVVLSK